jgi:alkaline phosphatase D
VCFTAAAASQSTIAEQHNNLAYASPHAQMPHLAVPFTQSRQLERDNEKRGNDKNNDNKNECGANSVSFIHGVASGDPYAESVVLWTRATPTSNNNNSNNDKHKQGAYKIEYTVATDYAMKNVVSKGKAYTSADVDYTVKVIAEGLKPATVYYYSFSACNGAVKSVVGTTKTLPRADANVNSVSFATVSCSYYSYGSFHAYGRIADKAKDLDVVLHLGKHCNESYILQRLLYCIVLLHQYTLISKSVPALLTAMCIATTLISHSVLALCVNQLL